MIKYPASIDTSTELITVVDNFTPINGALLNNIRDAILAVETELGIKPSGIYGTVRARITALELGLANVITVQGSFGGDLQGITSTSQKVIGLQSNPVADTAPTDGYVLTWSEVDGYWEPLPSGAASSFTAAGDLSGTPTNQTVIGLQGQPVDPVAPTDGYILQYLTGEWHPKPLPDSSLFIAGGDLSGTETSQQVVGIKNVALTPSDTLGTGEVWMKRGGVTDLIAGRPVLPGWFDPRDYGCPWDGIHDDLPGLNAMMAAAIALRGNKAKVVHFPEGRGYCSDNLHITNTFYFRGQSGSFFDTIGATAVQQGIIFAPLKGIILDNYYTCPDYPASNGSDGTILENFSLFSTICIVADPVAGLGRASKQLDTNQDIRHPATYVEKGICVIKSGSSGSGSQTDYNNEGATRGGVLVMFRCTTNGTTSSGGEPVEFGTAGLAQLGTTISDGSVVWTVESIPKDYQNSHAYVVGERVFLPGDTQCYFECVVAGTSIVAATPFSAANGIGVATPQAMVGPVYANLIIDDNGNPSGLKWKAYFPSAVNILSGSCSVRDVAVSGFTGYAVNCNSNLDITTYPDSGGFGGADFPTVKTLIAAYCGGGIRTSGSDTNGGLSLNCNFLFLGNGHTNVDAPDYLNLAEPTFGNGCAAILDRSLGGWSHSSNYAQFFSGSPYRNDNLSGGGNSSRWDTCIAETIEACIFKGNNTVIINCTRIADKGEGIIIGVDGRNLQEINKDGSDWYYARLTGSPGGAHAFHATPDGSNEWGWKYANGRWTMSFTGQNSNNAFYMNSFGVGSNPGSGYLGIERGSFLGDQATALFRGALDNASSSSGIKDRYLRAGFRRKGDKFEGIAKTIILTSDGFRGEPWQANQSGIYGGYEPWAIPPYIVEPTTNGIYPAAGFSVWKKTGSDTVGTTGATEPVWSTATPGGGALVGDQITDNDIVWELIGFTPSMIITNQPGGGTATIAMADTNQTATTAQIANGTLILTGVLTNDRTLFVPAAIDAAAYTLWIDNTCTGGQAVIVSTGSGTTVHVTNGYRFAVQIDSRGVTLLSAPVDQGAGQDSLRWGTSAVASSSLAIALGKQCTASGAAAVCIGEVSTAGPGSNATSIGYTNTSSGTYAVALGVACTATADNSMALGVNTNAARAGQLSHNSGHSNVQGMQAIDLMRLIIATTENLWDINGNPFILDSNAFISMNVRIVAASTSNTTKFATEVHELVISTPTGPAAVLVSDTTISGVGALAAQGWSVIISAIAGTNELEFACDAGIDTVRFMVRATWTQIGNLL